MWTKHVIPHNAPAPSAYRFKCAVEIPKDIYMFGGKAEEVSPSDALWKLAGTKQGGFAWSEIEPYASRKPSPRWGHSTWEFNNMLWIFGGCGSNAYIDNNHLFYFDISCHQWTQLGCAGMIPPSGCNRATTSAGDKVWLYIDPGQCFHWGDLYELDMQSLAWTVVDTGFNKPSRLTACTLTAVTQNTLVLDGCKGETSNLRIQPSEPIQGESLRNTWILDLISLSWRQHRAKPSEADYHNRPHEL